MSIHVVVASMLVVLSLAERKGPIVDTPLGSLEGHWQVSRGGRIFQAYEGIPYAKPPVGELRFEPPQRATAWKGVLPAKFAIPKCIQFTDDSVYTVEGTEDCLYLQIYVPGDDIGNSNRTKLLPVIVFFFGGAFQTGEASEWRPHFLMDKDIVFVSLNSRLGPLGYLSTEDEVVPGNMGLKDQAFAIKWVSENIESFGGDPNSVTLAGLSSGAGCVHLHYFSPMTRGLFHRGISVSGTALNPWSETEASLDKAKQLGDLMGCPTNDKREMIQCLKDRPAQTITEYSRTFLIFLKTPMVPFGPVVENVTTGAYLDKSPAEMIANGEAADLPWLVSSTTEEGVYPVTEFLIKEDLAKRVDENWVVLGPLLLDFNYVIPVSDHANVSHYVREYHMGNRSIEYDSAATVIRMVGNRLFAMFTGLAAKAQSSNYESPVWLYRFGYRGEHSISEIFDPVVNFGVGHCDENYYIFERLKSPLHTKEDIEMSKIFVNLWYSFAATGIPDLGVEWPRVNGTGDTLNFLHVSAPGIYNLANDDDYGERKFWSTINFDEYHVSSKKKKKTET